MSASPNLICSGDPQVSRGTWQVYKEVAEDFVNGYGYAIATGSATILGYFQQLCLEHGLEGCAFHIDYNAAQPAVSQRAQFLQGMKQGGNQ